jgi:hypothetical protein
MRAYVSSNTQRLPAAEVAAYSLHPGVIACDIWRRMPWPIEPLMKLFMKSPEKGARTSVYCATSPELDGASGGFYVDCREKAPNPAATPAMAAELWERSEVWTTGRRPAGGPAPDVRPSG